jgi:hypothetical protein
VPLIPNDMVIPVEDSTLFRIIWHRVPDVIANEFKDGHVRIEMFTPASGRWVTVPATARLAKDEISALAVVARHLETIKGWEAEKRRIADTNGSMARLWQMKVGRLTHG